MKKTNTTNVNTTVNQTNESKATQILNETKEQKQKELKIKKPVLNKVKYDASLLKFNATQDFKEMLTKIYATMVDAYGVHEKVVKQIVILDDKKSKITCKTELTDDDYTVIENIESEKSKLRKLADAYKKNETAIQSSVINALIKTTYDTYKNRFDDGKGFFKALNAWAKTYGQNLDNTVLSFIDKNVGSKPASIATWGDGLLDNTSDGVYALTVLYCLMQVAIDKNQMSMKLIEKSFDEIEEIANTFNAYKAIQVPSRTTKAFYKNAILENDIAIKHKLVEFKDNKIVKKSLNALTFEQIEMYFNACVKNNKYVVTYR